jgi:hypothetical protein
MPSAGRSAGSVPSLVSITARWRISCTAQASHCVAGPGRHDVDTQHILDLRDQGMAMTAIAAQVGMSLPGVWARYHRARPAKRPGLGDALHRHGFYPLVADAASTGGPTSVWSTRSWTCASMG